jgi:hypothetical protein
MSSGTQQCESLRENVAVVLRRIAGEEEGRGIVGFSAADNLDVVRSTIVSGDDK